MNGLGAADRARGGAGLERAPRHRRRRARRPRARARWRGGWPSTSGCAFLDTGLLYRAVAPAPARSRAAIRATRRQQWPQREALAPRGRRARPAARRGDRPGRLDRGGRAGRARGAAAVPAPLRGADGRGAVLAGPRRRHGGLPGRDASSCSSPRATEERARRRYEELRARGDAPIYAAVLEELQRA